MYYDKNYWDKQYEENLTGWNIGYVSTPIKDYIDQLSNKSLKILIPGAGNAYEAEYLHKNGFQNVFILEFSDEPISNLLKRCPEFPITNIIKEDFFYHVGQYDLIIEHTFFSSLNISTREQYVNKTHELLRKKGKLVGLLFAIKFGNPFPPYGGHKDDYRKLFRDKFHIKTLKIAHNSIKPRANNEYFIIFEKNNNYV
jgi:thiopurine S-methyltransferase